MAGVRRSAERLYDKAKSNIMDKFKDKYRIPSARAPWWDYSADGSYFITINSKRGQYLFGDIIDNDMYLSDFGEIINEEWLRSFEIRKELFCDTYCIMPNHIHAIVHIEKNYFDRTEIKKHGVAIRQPRSLSTFVGAMKGAATRRISKISNYTEDTFWHVRFHDHIIRTDFAYQHIYDYIQENPAKWESDKFHQNNLKGRDIEY